MATLYGGDTVNDAIYGESGEDDLIYGLGGDDGLFDAPTLNRRADTIYGGDGNDLVFSLGGADELFGGKGSDGLLLDRSRSGIGLDLRIADNGAFTLSDGAAGSGFEVLSLVFGRGDDTVSIGPAFEVLAFAAGAGTDSAALDFSTANSGIGAERSGAFWALSGGYARDNHVLLASVENLTLLAGSGGDRIHGAGFASVQLFGNSGDDWLAGSNGGDTLHGDSGADVLLGGSGDDNIAGGSENDRLLGGAGGDHLWGDGGNDSLYGGSNRDYLYGGTGNDRLAASDGGSRLEGGEGGDRVIGGAGDDLFVFAAGSGVDRVENFTVGTDHIYLSGVATGDVSMAVIGSRLVLSWGSDRVTIYGLADPASVTLADLIVTTDDWA